MSSEARKIDYDTEQNEQDATSGPTNPDDTACASPDSEVPSWFVRTYDGASPTEIAQRYHKTFDETLSQAAFATPSPQAYEAYKRRLEERFRTAQAVVDPAHGGPAAASHKSRKPLRPTRMPFAPHVPRGTQPRRHRMGIAAALATTLLACVIGGTGGYLVAKPSVLASASFNPVEIATGLFSKYVTNTGVQVANTSSEKTSPLATINVRDVAGPVNGPIPLSITASATDQANPISIKISGLPQDAYLTKGVHIANGEWLIKSAEINNAELVVPRSTSSTLGLEVAALDERTGIVAAPPKQMNVVLDLSAIPLPGAVPPPENLAQNTAQGPAEHPIEVRVEPVSAMPNQGFNKTPGQGEQLEVPQPQQVLEADALKLISKGRSLMAKGDVISARQFFLKAHGMKANDAAFYVGQTYDPATFAALGITALEPDLNLAAEWYGKAAAQGFAPAQQALMKLGSN